MDLSFGSPTVAPCFLVNPDRRRVNEIITTKATVLPHYESSLDSKGNHPKIWP